MDKIEYILLLTDWVLFALCSFLVLYLIIFSVASLFNFESEVIDSSIIRKILVIFPAYKEDRVIDESVNKFMGQDYPSDKYKIVVVSDQMSFSTNERLSALPITLLHPVFEQSSKAKALQYAIENCNDDGFEIVVILDADNIVEADFLKDINNSFNNFRAVQAHRTSKNRNTSIAVLDSISEEINNSIFRKGHNNLGLSSALIGSGMAFDFDWFKKNVNKLSTVGEDKELEGLLLKERIHIEYLNHTPIYDEKTQKSSAFYNQRRRWLATQLYSFKTGVKGLYSAIIDLNVDYIDKLFQWMMPPRIVFVGFIFIFSVVVSVLNISLSIKWWSILFCLIFALCISIPKEMWDKKLLKATINIPLLLVMMLANYFRIKGGNKTFIHTEKNYKTDGNSDRSTTNI